MIICTNPECQTTAGCQCRQPFRYETAAAWICPRCGKVWGPQIPGCFNCNAEVDRGAVATGTNPSAKR